MRVFRQEEVLGPAYHEAGHAVAAYFLGRELPGLTMEPIEEAEGNCSYSLWGDVPETEDEETRSHLEDELVVCLAGPAAEDLAVGSFDEELSESDLLLALELSEAAVGDEEAAEAFWDRARERAERTLQDAWPAVQALAEALVGERRLEGDRVRAVIEEALQQK